MQITVRGEYHHLEEDARQDMEKLNDYFDGGCTNVISAKVTAIRLTDHKEYQAHLTVKI